MPNLPILRAVTLGAALALSALPALAEILVMDPYARSSSANAPVGAAFMVLHNTSDAEDRLIAVRSDIAKRVELHTHIENTEGVMQMREVEGGIPVPAHAKAVLERGGYHVMLMGLTKPFRQGDTFTITLVFDHAGEMMVEVPVDLDRKPSHSDGQTHSD